MLWRKMIRDIKENKMAYIACIVVITIGLMVFTSMSMVMDNLNAAKNQFYEEFHFADGFAKVKAMPYSEIDKLNKIEGIEEVQGRIVQDVRVLWPDREENTYIRLISMNLEQPPLLNQAYLVEGSSLVAGEETIWIGSMFFKENNLKLGDQIPVVVEGKKVDLNIVGTGQSPEFVYVLQNASNLYPDYENFDIAYIPYDTMESIFNAKGTVNDITFSLKTGYEFEDVEQSIKNKLEKYGLESLVSRENQISNVMLREELKGLQSAAQSIPILFLVISSIILYIMLKRVVEQQRGQIGTLKAFGYSQMEILFHYLSYGSLIGLIGGIAGGLLGTVLSGSYTEMYKIYFNLPNLENHFSFKYFIWSILLSLLFSLFASFQGTKGVLKLRPADAMHPPVPKFGKKLSIENIRFLWNTLTVQGQMAMRNIFRNKGRSFFIFIGITFTFSMMATLLSFQGMIDVMMVDQFTKIQIYDVKMSFNGPKKTKEIERELNHQLGIKRLETMLEVPVTLKNQYRKKDVGLLGIEKNTQLYNILDDQGNYVQLPSEGIILAETIAKDLKVEVGDQIQLESPWAKDSPIKVNVVDVIPQYLGSNVYMNQKALQELLGQGEIVTSAIMDMEQESISLLKEDYNTSKQVAGIGEKQQSIDQFYELMGSFGYMIWVMAVMAIITGFAIVYNSSIISLSERKRELASLRVMGMSPKEVLEVISFEQWLIGLIGMIMGIPLTYVMKQGMADSMNNDLYSMPVATEPSAFILAFLGTCIAIWIAQKTIMRKIRRLDLVDVLKERE